MGKIEKDRGYWRTLHAELGCAGCYWAEADIMGHGPCCTKLYGCDVDANGRCTAREERDQTKRGD